MIDLKGIKKSFGNLEVLRGIDLHVGKGEIVSIVGPSGAGKTTLLQIMGTLDRADSGSVILDGVDVNSLSGRELSRFRNRKIGFVFQSHQLLNEFTALENVMIPAHIAKTDSSEAKRRAEELLDFVGLSQRSHHKPLEMSGGEQQRTAIARSLISNPTLILADEPTANLDHRTGATVVRMLRELCSTLGVTVVASTHDPTVAQEASRVVAMRDGRIVDE